MLNSLLAAPALSLTFLAFSGCSKAERTDTLPANTGHIRTDVPVLSTIWIKQLDYEQNEQQLITEGWTPVFREEFNDGLFTKWQIWNGGAYNNELQLYQADNLMAANGVLTIVAKAETKAGNTLPSDPTPKNFNYTSGRIESKQSFSSSPGTPKVRMAARIKLPQGYGMWPAFWSYGDPWPTQGEIDILEARGQYPTKFQTAYWYGRRAGVNLARNTEGYFETSADLTANWHVYELIWEKDKLTFLLDGQVIETKVGGYIPNMYRKSQRVVVNLAVGGGFFSNLDPSLISVGALQVDWIKVFTSK